MSLAGFNISEFYQKDLNLHKEDIEKLQEWAQKQQHLPTITERQLILFLHSCYYRLDETKLTIDNYFTMKTLHPSIFNYCSSKSQLEYNFSVASVLILPEKTPDGFAIMHFRFLDFRPEKLNFLEQLNVGELISTLYAYENGPVNGFISIIDVKGGRLGHVNRIGLTALKTLIQFLQEASYVRIKAIHFINIIPVLDKVMLLIKPLLKPTLRDSMYFHKTVAGLHKYVPQSILPEELGGNSTSLSILQEQALTNILKNNLFFQEVESQKVDESKRLEKTINNENIFGLNGNFKKLDLD